MSGSPARASLTSVAAPPSPKLTCEAAPAGRPFSTVSQATSSRAAAWSTPDVAGATAVAADARTRRREGDARGGADARRNARGGRGRAGRDARDAPGSAGATEGDAPGAPGARTA